MSCTAGNPPWAAAMNAASGRPAVLSGSRSTVTTHLRRPGAGRQPPPVLNALPPCWRRYEPPDDATSPRRGNARVRCPRLRSGRWSQAGSVTELAENAEEMSAVGLAQLAEGPFGLGSAGGPDRVEDLGAVLGHLDQRGPPVTRIGPTYGQATGFERVDDLGGRARRDAQVIRQLRQPHHPVALEHPQRAEVRRSDVPGGQGFLGRFA